MYVVSPLIVLGRHNGTPVVVCQSSINGFRRDHIDGVRGAIHCASSIRNHSYVISCKNWCKRTAHCFARAVDAINVVPTKTSMFVTS